MQAFLVVQLVKNLPAMQKTQVRSLSQEDPWRREWQPTPVFLPGEFHGQRSPAGYSPWGHKKSDTTERLLAQILGSPREPVTLHWSHSRVKAGTLLFLTQAVGALNLRERSSASPACLLRDSARLCTLSLRVPLQPAPGWEAVVTSKLLRPSS